MLDAARTQIRLWQRDGRFPAVTRAAAYLWYQGKNLRDLVQVRAVRRAIEAGAVPADLPGQVGFVMDRFGGTIRPLQERREITQLLREVTARQPRTVLEIGTARGGTLFLLCQAAHPEATVVSLDLPFGRNGGGFPRWKEPLYARFARPGQRLVLLRGDSHDPASRTAVEAALDGRRLDFILIDADHSYAGVRRDFEMYAPLLAPGGLIALHDILENRFDPSIDVHRFWRELAATHPTRTIVADAGQGVFGIGLVTPG